MNVVIRVELFFSKQMSIKIKSVLFSDFLNAFDSVQFRKLLSE